MKLRVLCGSSVVWPALDTKRTGTSFWLNNKENSNGILMADNL